MNTSTKILEDAALVSSCKEYDAYVLGWKAYNLGICCEVDNNPFTSCNSVNKRAWYTGWLDCWRESKYES